MVQGLKRCGKSCRLRWMNYLRPNVKHGNFTQQENQLILQLHQQYGNKWSVIAAALPGRTDNKIKNHWHTNLRKLITHHQTSSSVNQTDTVRLDFSAEDLPHPILESSLLSPETISSSSTSSTPVLTTSTTDPAADSWPPEIPTAPLVDGDEDFWTQPFLMESSSTSIPDLLLSSDDLLDSFYLQEFPIL